MKYFIHTTGCKANQWDSYIISTKLKGEGLTPCPMLHADVVIINACTLTVGAERDIRKFINRCRDVNGMAKIVLAGCHAQAYPDQTFGADVVLGHEEKFNIEEFMDRRGSFVKKGRMFSLEETIVKNLPAGKTRFFFKIQDGCDKFCSYCVVPYARGMPRSRPVGEIIETLKLLKEKGVGEVVLTGIEIASYNDPISRNDLKGLLMLLDKTETPDRIRISSIDPLYIDDGFIEIIANSQKIANSLHIPVQSGSNPVLERMGRRYNQAYIKNVLEKIKSRIKEIGIGVDVIAGFPGEDEEAYDETYRFLESADIYYFHIFPFSARKGTPAFSMENSVPESIKKQRVRKLKILDMTKRASFYRRFFGRELWIIAETKVYRGLYMRGYTGNYIPVYIPYQKNLENKLVKVKIMGMQDGLLLGAVNR